MAQVLAAGLQALERNTHMTIKISNVHFSHGTDETTTGWWYTHDGVSDILENGSLAADSEREDVLEAIAQKLHVAAVIEV